MGGGVLSIYTMFVGEARSVSRTFVLESAVSGTQAVLERKEDAEYLVWLGR